jgi:magnesium transporter
MAERTKLIRLLDPDLATLRREAPKELHGTALERLLEPIVHDDEPRPAIEAHGDYVFAVFLVPVLVAEEDRLFYQEVDFVMTEDTLLAVRKTPPGEHAYEPDEGTVAKAQAEPVGMTAYRLVDDIAERFLDLVDTLNDEIDELEDSVERWDPEKVRNRLSELRHDILHIRRVLAPTRDAVRAIIDDRIELDDGELFPRDVEIAFGAAYDKLMRATDGLELSRDLVAGVRDYHQSKIANDQNEVMKKLTAIASILLVPTFIVGLYGQNFRHIPELGWMWGYWWSWAWILAATALQLWFFRRRRWI